MVLGDILETQVIRGGPRCHQTVHYRWTSRNATKNGNPLNRQRDRVCEQGYEHVPPTKEYQASEDSSYSPQQNGLAERRNLTIMQMTRCVLIESKLPYDFWPYAVRYAVYTLNLTYKEHRLEDTI